MMMVQETSKTCWRPYIVDDDRCPRRCTLLTATPLTNGSLSFLGPALSQAGVFQDTGNFSIFPGQGHWTAREEVRLLDAIEQYGYGNWEDIARHIETRTPDEARNKYISSYIDGAIGRASWKPALERLQLPIEHTVPDTGPLSPTLGSSLPSQPPSTEENTILGYMPHRDDFEREWDNDAETTIAPLFIHPVDDEDVDMALKLAQVDMYMRRLRERSRRKRVVRDFQVVPQFFKKEREKAQVPPKKKSKDDKEAVAEKLRTISQFQTASEHNNLINSIVRERELRTRIRELLRYRRNGIRHVEECHEFEVARSRRDRKKENKKKGPSIHNFAFHAGQPASDSDSNGPHRKVKRCMHACIHKFR
ncbi:transcriptional adapter 2B-like isoform X1 [Penaeus indicus]|uniref:transcriptional adapter 2B-like isoform X1 n=1 Tax=Penaeus indicus TaxID=29960 RepID=UPI00300D0C07